jgi:Ni,Fe-hydrogenase III small subunit
MVDPLRRAYESMPEPRLVAALGDCAIACQGPGDPGQLAGPLEKILPVDLRIPGCPPTPQQIADALLHFMRERAERPQIRDAYVVLL